MARKKETGNSNVSSVMEIFQEIARESNLTESKLMDDIFDTPILVFNELIGGIPKGRIVNIASEPGAGKTTLMVQFLSHLRRKYNTNIIYIDTEQSMSQRRFSELGLNIEEILYVQPQTLEDAYTFILKVLQKKKDLNDMEPMVIAFDSITATPTKKDIQIDDDTDFQQQVGHRARINSKVIPIIQTFASQTNTTILMINQLRKNIQIGFGMFGGPQEEIVGGLSLLYYASVDVRLTQSNAKNKMLESNEINGKLVWAKAKKNRLMSPMIEFPMILDFHNGFDDDLSSLAFLLEYDEYSKEFLQTGSWYKIKDVPGVSDREFSFRLSEYKQMCQTNPEFKQVVDNVVAYICRTEFKNIPHESVVEYLVSKNSERNKKHKDMEKENVQKGE